MAGNNERIDYITFISAVSAVSVVILHTNGCFWKFSATEGYWPSANVIECIFYFAVPLFFMISGITLMDFYDRNTLKEYFFKRFIKTFIPFLAWNFIAILFELATDQIQFADLSLKSVYQGITGNGFVKIYWFFGSLFIIYLCMPLFAAVSKEKRKTVFSFLAAAGFVLNLLIPFLQSVFGTDLNTPLSIPVVSGVLIWPLLGWLLHNCRLTAAHKVIIYIISLSGLLMHMIGTYTLSMEAGEIISTFKGYQNVPSVLYAVGIFVLLKDIGEKIMSGRAKAFFNWFGSYTFPIYLMQFIFLYLLPLLPFADTTSMLYRLGAPFIIIPVIIVITWIIRKVPGLRVIVP